MRHGARQCSFFDFKLMSFLVKTNQCKGKVGCFNLISHEDGLSVAAIVSALKQWHAMAPPSVLITDDASVDQSPWEYVFEKTIKRLLCHFHVMKVYSCKFHQHDVMTSLTCAFRNNVSRFAHCSYTFFTRHTSHLGLE